MPNTTSLRLKYSLRHDGQIILYSAIFVASTIATAEFFSIDYSRLTRDPVAIAETDGKVAWYGGWLTYFGVLIWAGSSVVSWFSAKWAVGTTRTFLITGGLLGAYMSVDDLFMLHDKAFLRIGIDEEPTLVVLALATLVWVFKFRTTLVESCDFPLLIAAAIGFGAWTMLDSLEGRLNVSTAEESLKLFGILCWASFFWLFAQRIVDGRLGDQLSKR